jgi:hypothetical protein
MRSTKNVVKWTGSWRRSGEPHGRFVALFVPSPHDCMRMFHNNAGFLVLQIIFAGRFTRFQTGLPTLVLRVWDGRTGMVRWKYGRCPALWSVLYGLGGAVLRGYGNLVLEVFRMEDTICDVSV